MRKKWHTTDYRLVGTRNHLRLTNAVSTNVTKGAFRLIFSDLTDKNEQGKKKNKKKNTVKDIMKTAREIGSSIYLYSR